jgi:hypothetical protein
MLYSRANYPIAYTSMREGVFDAEPERRLTSSFMKG